MKYIPFVIRIVIVLIVSAFIAKWLGVSFRSIFAHVVWLFASWIVYIAAAGAHLALDKFMIERQDRRSTAE